MLWALIGMNMVHDLGKRHSAPNITNFLREHERLVHLQGAHLQVTKLDFAFFQFLFVKMNHSEVHLMISLNAVDSKVLKMAILLEYLGQENPTWRM